MSLDVMFVVDDITLIDCYSSYSTKYTELAYIS